MRIPAFRTSLLALALVALGAPLAAQGRGPGFGPGAKGPGLRHLNLTAAQQTQVKAIRDQHQAALQAKVEAAQAARKALHDAMANATTDAATLKALHDKASAAQFDVMLEHRAVRAEILPLLTPDQQATFQAAGPGRGPGRGKGRRGGGPGFGPGMNPDCPLSK